MDRRRWTNNIVAGHEAENYVGNLEQLQDEVLNIVKLILLTPEGELKPEGIKLLTSRQFRKGYLWRMYVATAAGRGFTRVVNELYNILQRARDQKLRGRRVHGNVGRGRCWRGRRPQYK